MDGQLTAFPGRARALAVNAGSLQGWAAAGRLPDRAAGLGAQCDGELVADLRAQVPHWARVVEQSASRHRPDSLLRSDSRINRSDWQEGVQVPPPPPPLLNCYLLLISRIVISC